MIFASSHIRTLSLPTRVVRGAVGAAVTTLMWLALSTPVAQADVATFQYSSAYQYFVVPTGVESVHFDVVGAAGAAGQGLFGGGTAGSGGAVIGDLPVTPGETLTLWAGGGGQPDGGAGYGNPSHNDFEGGTGGTAAGVGAGTSGGGASGGGYHASAQVAGSSYGDTEDGGDSATSHAGRGGFADDTNSDNGGLGGDGDPGYGGGGGGGGGGGYFVCAPLSPYFCFSAGGSGQGGSDSWGGGGGSGGNSYADPSAANISYGRGSSTAGTPGQITLSFGAPSAATVTASTATSYPGQSVTFRAFVDPTDGGGTISFTNDGTALAGCSNLPFASGGGTDWEASCSTTSLTNGSHTITALYSGDGVYAGGTASTTENVYQSATSASLTSSASSVTVDFPGDLHRKRLLQRRRRKDHVHQRQFNDHRLPRPAARTRERLLPGDLHASLVDPGQLHDRCRLFG